jgi:hypothetical protein
VGDGVAAGVAVPQAATSMDDSIHASKSASRGQSLGLEKIL